MTTPQSVRVSRWQRVRRGLLLGGVVAALLLLIWDGNWFAQARLRLANVYYVASPISGNIVIVALDNASLAEYGRSPVQWSRRLYADLIQKLAAANARVVAFDLLFVEPTEDDATFAQAITEARQSEVKLRTVMPVVGGQRAGALIAAEQSLLFEDTLKPVTGLFDAAQYYGYVNAFPDVDSTIRRQPSLIQAGEETHLAFSLVVYLAYLRIPMAGISQVVQSREGELQLAQRTLLVDQTGFWLQNYFGPPSDQKQQTFQVVSLRDVLTDSADMTLFADKIVLVGLMDDVGATDQYPVPSSLSGRFMAGVEIHANAIETLIQNKPLREQSRFSQAVMIIGLALGSSLLYAQLRWYWMVIASLILLVVWVIFAFVDFSARLEIINLFHSGLALLVPMLANVGQTITVEVNRRRKTQFLLESVVDVSSQRLVLENVFPSIAADVRRIVKASTGVIWLCNEDSSDLKLAYQWGLQPPGVMLLQATAGRAQSERRVVLESNQGAFPVIWQGRLLAVLAVQAASGKRIETESLALLGDLTQQIASGLENAILYTQVQQQKILLEAILAGSPAGIFVLDSDLRVVLGNAAFDAALQTTTALGTGLFQLLETLPEALQGTLQTYFKAGKAFRQELQLNGKTFNLDAAVLSDFKQWVVLFNDVTVLADLSKLKTQMIRMASHDLKNPLSRVLGYGSLLLDMRDESNPLSSEDQQFIGNMVKSANEMNQIITDILNLEQLRSATIQRQPVNLRAVVEEVMARYQPDIANKRQTLTADLHEDVAWVSGGPAQLTEVVSNLLGNAIKYTPEGGRIMLRLHMNEQHDVQFETEDTGYGISEEAQKKLFTEFYRVRTKATSNIPGTGLGLSLVKSVVEAHGGRIWVKSQEGVGTTFFVELPAMPDEQKVEHGA